MEGDLLLDDERGACGCGGKWFFSRGCGAVVCDRCDAHRGFSRCFCGWSESGGDGRAELEAMGEVIEPEEPW